MQSDFEAEVGAYVERVYENLSGLVVSAMIYLGHHTGLYRAMQDAGPLTSAQIAQRAGLAERWVREWLRGQAAARLIDYHADGTFELSAVGGLVLANADSPACSIGVFIALPHTLQVLEPLRESFRTGRGLPYDAFGPEGAKGIEGLLGPWFRTMLVPLALPRLEGVVDKLAAGGAAADIGCGTGLAPIEIAKAFPRAQVHGYEISQHALAAAERNRQTAGVTNVVFHDAAREPLPEDGSFDLITAFDCIHDMTHPAEALRAIRRSLKPDGTFFLVDVNAEPTFEANLATNPQTAMLYGFSILSCLSSGLSEPGGAGLGTLGLTEPVAREMTAAAGFTRFTRIDLGNPFNAYYEVRP